MLLQISGGLFALLFASIAFIDRKTIQIGAGVLLICMGILCYILYDKFPKTTLLFEKIYRHTSLIIMFAVGLWLLFIINIDHDFVRWVNAYALFIYIGGLFAFPLMQLIEMLVKKERNNSMIQ
jgi:hypothetical protein